MIREIQAIANCLDSISKAVTSLTKVDDAIIESMKDQEKQIADLEKRLLRVEGLE